MFNYSKILTKSELTSLIHKHHCCKNNQWEWDLLLESIRIQYWKP